VLQEWYQSTKVGVNEASTRHMVSLRLTLPTVFGRTKEGVSFTSRHHVPAIKSFNDGNTFDGVTEMKSYIAMGMEDLKFQLRQNIEHSFGADRPVKARILAMEMHKSYPRTLQVPLASVPLTCWP
jgi:hypothetical protein